MNSFSDLVFMYEKCEHFEDLFDRMFDLYVELCQRHFKGDDDYCYICHCRSVDVEHYNYLRSNECYHCPADRYLTDPTDLCPLVAPIVKTAVFQSSEVQVEDQETVNHSEQPNAMEPARTVISRFLVSEPPSVANILEREYLLNKNLTWTTSQPIGTRIGFVSSPNELIQASTAIQGIMAYHGMIRANVEVTIRLNANPFICGQLALCAVPQDFLVLDAAMSNSLELYPHSYLNAGFETNATVVVPYVCSHTAHVNVASNTLNQSTQLQVFVWNVLRVASGQPTSFTANVWFKFVDIEVGVKMPSIATRTVYQSGEATGLSNIVRTVGSGIANSNIPIISQIAKVVGGVTGMYDAPIAAQTVPNAIAVVDVPKVALDMRVLSHDFATPVAYETVNMKKYISTYGRVYVDSWDTSIVAGALLLEMSTTFNQKKSSSPDVGGYQVPLLEVGRNFAFWRGALKFKIQVIATRFHQGQLLLSWTPFGRCIDINIARATYYMSIDIGQSNTFEVEVPYLYPLEYCPTGTEDHGFLQLWVQNPLVAPQNVSTTVSINVYLAGGDDFEFSTYQNPKHSVYQASASGLGTSEVWKPLGNISVPPNKKMGGHTHIEHILRRPGQAFTTRVISTAAESYQLLATVPFIETTDRDNFPIPAYFASGGGRWSITTDLPLNARFLLYGFVTYGNSNTALVVHSAPIPYTGYDRFAMRGGAFFQPIQSAGERTLRYELPMYIPAEYYCLFKPDTLYGTPSMTLLFLSSEPLNFNIVMYWEAADDFRLSWPLTGPVRSIVVPPGKTEDKEDDAIKAETLPVLDAVYQSKSVYEVALEEASSKVRNFEKDEPAERCKMVVSDTEMCFDGASLYEVKLAEDIVGELRFRQFETNKYATYQGLDFFTDLFKDVKDYLGTVQSRLAKGWHNVCDAFGAMKESVCFINDARLWGHILKDAITYLTTNLLPAISAIYAAWHATGVVKMVALTQLTAMAFNISCPEERKEGVEYESDRYKIVIENGKHVVLDAKTGYKIAERQGFVDDLASITDVVGSVSRNFCKSVLTHLGCWVSSDYDAYIRRMTIGIVPDSWEHCIKVFGHSLLYFIHGKSLNVEWERKQKLPIAEAIKNYNMDCAGGLFTGSQLHHTRLNKTNFEILQEYFETTQKVYSLCTEMNIPASMARSVEDIKCAYSNACRKDRVEITQCEPVGIFLNGEPGCGKSLFASTLLPALVIAYTNLPIPTSGSLVFPYPEGEGSKFWDGYAQQPFIFHDEFLQERDSKEPKEVLRNISSARPIVNMAALEDKGIAFDSKFYICGSNEVNLQNVTTILKPEALRRRFPFSYTMKAKSEYRDCFGKPNVTKMTVDAEKLDKEAPDFVEKLTALCDDIWSFTVVFDAHEGVGDDRVEDAYAEERDSYRNKLVNGPAKKVEHRAKDFIPAIGRKYMSSMENYTKFKKLNEDIIQSIRKKARAQGDSDSDDESDDSFEETIPTLTTSVAEQVRAFTLQQQQKGYPYAESTGSDVTDDTRPFDINDAASVASFQQRAREAHQLKIVYDDILAIYNDYITEDMTDSEIRRDYIVGFNNAFVSFSNHFTGDRLADLIRIFPKNKPLVKAVMDLLGDCYKPKQRSWMGLLKVLGIAGAAATGIATAIYGISRILYALIPKLQSYTGENIVGHLKAQLTPKPVLKAVSMQQRSDYIDFHKVIHNNMVVIECTKGSSCKTEKLSGLFLDDRTLLMNTHLVDKYFEWAAAGEPVAAVINFKVGGSNESYPLRIEKGYTRRVSTNGIPGDLTLIRTRVPARGMRNIWNFVAVRDSFVRLGKKEVYVKGGERTVNGSDDIYGHISAFTKFAGTEGIFLEVYSDEKTEAGDCGRPYLMVHVGIDKPLVGIHACLSSNSIGAVPLIYEDLRAVADTFEAVITLEPPVDVIVKEPATDKYWKSEVPLYSAVLNKVPLVHHSSKQTALKPLQYQGIRVKHPDWDCDYQPASLRANGSVHPLITNAQKYEPNAVYGVDSATHACLLDFFSNKFNNHQAYQREYSIDEAINGTDVMNPLKYTTGSGYWSMFGFKDGKKEFFTELPQEYDTNGEALPLRRTFSDKAKQHVVPIWDQSFVQRLAKCTVDIHSGRVFSHFWISSNKDELRPLAKVQACKTRVFEQPGLEYTLLVRQCFGGFLDYFKTRSGFTFYHGIGDEKEAVWKTYSKVLKEHSVYGHAFDYKNYDGSLSQDAFQFFEDVCDRFYNDKGKPTHKARMCLIRILRDAQHVMGQYYFQTSKGNKSGNPFTDVFNSVCNFYVMGTAYLKCRAVAGLAPNMNTFDDEIRMLTYGDDVIITAKQSTLEYFRGELIAEILSLYGYTITDSLKSGVVPPYVNFEDLTFLKSPFIDYDGVCLAPLPKKDIYKELCYAPKQFATDETDVQQRVANVLRFMAHHGPVDLEIFKKQLASRGIPRKWMSFTFDTFINEIRGKQSVACVE